MGYFSEMSLDMQEGRKPFAATPTRECAFEDGESFDELPVPPADRQSTPPAPEQAGAFAVELAPQGRQEPSLFSDGVPFSAEG